MFEKITKSNKSNWCPNCDVRMDSSKKRCMKCGSLLTSSNSKKNRNKFNRNLK